jgi:hypothetical protein
MVVTIDRNPLRASAPALLHDLRALHVETYGWDILPDGRLLGIERSPAEEDPGSTNVSLNWLSTVRSRLPR